MSSVTGKANGKNYSVLETPTQINIRSGRAGFVAEGGVYQFRVYLGLFPELRGKKLTLSKKNISMYFIGRDPAATTQWKNSRPTTVTSCEVSWEDDMLMISFANPGNLINQGMVVFNENVTITLG